MPKKVKAKIVLKGGFTLFGYSFGAPVSSAGEVVFNTSMVGYPEGLTDPSYKGQIFVFTYPLIGNYGVPGDKMVKNIQQNFESEKIHVRGVVISDLCMEPSHHESVKTLDKWLKNQGISGIYGVDTRELTKRLREKGSSLGKIIVDKDIPFYDPNKENLVEQVSCKERVVYGKGKTRILLIDCGVKNNIIRSFVQRDCTVIRVPYDYDFSNEDYDGVFISNGPGDPKMCQAAIKNIKKELNGQKPVFGICMGNQILALAAGANTYKLKYGHHAVNQPCVDLETGRCYITSQNHGYAVDAKTLPESFQPWFENANDKTNEGIRHRTKPFFSVQFHPEASPGPTDTAYLFDYFLDCVRRA